MKCALHQLYLNKAIFKRLPDILSYAEHKGEKNEQSGAYNAQVANPPVARHKTQLDFVSPCFQNSGTYEFLVNKQLCVLKQQIILNIN